MWLVISKLLSLTKKKASAPDEACEDENSKFVGTIGLTNDPATCQGVKSWKGRDYLAQSEPHSQQKYSPETRVMRHGFLTSTAKWWSGRQVVLQLFCLIYPLTTKKLILPQQYLVHQGMTFLERVLGRFSRKNVVNLHSFRYINFCAYWNYQRRKEVAGGPWPPWILKFLAKNGCFLNFEWEKNKVHHFWFYPGKIP